MKSHEITAATVVNPPIAVVWCAYTTPAGIEQWNIESDDWHTTESTVALLKGSEKEVDCFGVTTFITRR